MAKKAEPINSITIEGEEYFTVPELAKKYNVHSKRIHNCMSRMKIPRKQLGGIILVKDDPRFDPNYQKPANPGAFKKGEDGRRQHIISYIELNKNIKNLIEAVEGMQRKMDELCTLIYNPPNEDDFRGQVISPQEKSISG